MYNNFNLLKEVVARPFLLLISSIITITGSYSVKAQRVALADIQSNKTIQPHTGTYNQKLQHQNLLFMENRGQVTDDKGKLQPDILFTAKSGDAQLYLTSNAIHYQFIKTEYPKGYDPHKRRLGKDLQQQAKQEKQIQYSTHRFTMQLQGANLHPVIFKEKQSDYVENYYSAHCPDGITGVHGYEKLIYINVYPNIDWIIYSRGGYIEYDFMVHPGGDPAQIRLKQKDAESESITKEGELLLKTRLGEVHEKKPVSYMDNKEIITRFKEFNDGSIGFNVKAPKGHDLRIDPAIIWATYYGANTDDYGYSCAADGSGNVYLAGESNSSTSIASGGFQNTFAGGGSDAFLVKFSSSGNRLWATYYGGSGYDQGEFCTLDVSGNVYLSGYTTSNNGIASGGFQNSFGGMSDAFLVKFSNTGSRLWATYYGGSNSEQYAICATDGSGSVYLGGYTSSTTNIAFGGFQNTYGGGGDDAFLVKFSSSGSRLWATYYGGNKVDAAFSCNVDGDGNVYLAGETSSISGIAAGGFQNSYGGGVFDAFLVKFNSSGNRLWATYFGGSGEDGFSFCSTDANENVYLSGSTHSATGIASGGFQNTLGGGSDGLMVKFTSTGNMVWATYYGGSSDDLGYSCVVDRSGNVYMTGRTSSINGISSNGFQNTYGGGADDAFLVKFTSSGSRLWSSYYGGSGDESPEAATCTLDTIGNLYMAGQTYSASGIASGGFQNTYAGGSDAFLIKIKDSTSIPNVTYTFIGNGNWNDPTNWLGNIVPQSPVPNSTIIIINPPSGSECILNVPVTFSQGSKLSVATGAIFKILGNLTILLQ